MSSNTELRSQAMRTGKDTQDLVQYFQVHTNKHIYIYIYLYNVVPYTTTTYMYIYRLQREVEVKDDIIARLNEEMVRKETQLRNEV